MGDQGLLCETLCQQSGWVGELVLLLLIGARALYLGWRNGRLTQDNVSLQKKVELLSLPPPPAVPAQVTLQLAPNPGLANLVPIAVSIAPADLSSAAKNAKNAIEAEDGDPFAPDPDHVEPPKDGP